MYQIKSLRFIIFSFIIAFAAILLLTISPISGKLHAASNSTMLFSGSVNTKPVETPSSKKPVATKKKASTPKRNAPSSKKAVTKNNHAQAVFAMGCFWCAESDFEKVPGVIDVISGYTGGHVKDPNYEQVSYTETGHYEAILVTYDPTKVKYSRLLRTFWLNVDPFDDKGQFCDKGSSYKAAIFPQGSKQMAAAKASKDYLVKFFKKDLTPKIIERSKFYPAEDYHQDYYKKNPLRYKQYRTGCRRDERLKSIWGNPKKP